MQRLGGLLDRGELGDSGVDEQHVDGAESLLSAGEQGIEVGEPGNVRTDGRRVAADGPSVFSSRPLMTTFAPRRANSCFVRFSVVDCHFLLLFSLNGENSHKSENE